MSSQRGFTLIEIMIVLAILASIIGLVAPRMIRKDANIKTVARKFIILSKEVRNKARLSNSTYRLAIELGQDGSKYWIEKANGPQPVDPEAYEKEKEKSNSDEEGPPPLFQPDKSILKGEQNLPKGLRFGSVETINMRSPMSSGVAYVHFFGEGFVEAAAVQITNGNNLTWTLVFNPLTGQADIVEKAHSLKDNPR